MSEPISNKTPAPLNTHDCIYIQGAREHNLKNITVAIPRNKFVVVTGVSGSGKSTLAFDLLFAEGQRRFLDSMNVYARQFVEQMSRPDVDLITGIPPTVSIEQRNSRGGGKSTVATVTEVYHFIRLMFARLGKQWCPDCSVPVEGLTRDELGLRLKAEMKKRGDLLLLAPVVRNRKGFHTDVGEWAAKHGYTEIRADGKMHPTNKELRLDRFKEHNVEIVVGVLEKKRRDSVKSPQLMIDEALKLGKGTFYALDNHGRQTLHSTERACPECGRSFGPLDPKMFSYNSSQGWCTECRGFGETFYLPEVERGARGDAIEESWFEWQEGKRESCPSCHGARLNPISRAVRLATGKKQVATIDSFSSMNVEQASKEFSRMTFTGTDALIARDIIPEISERLKFLQEVGLNYLQLGRSVTTLSGGETQRIRLGAQLGSNLSGVLYVLDEPTIGLHARDNDQLLNALESLRRKGNSLLVVEHDEETMRRADHIIDLGPAAGVHGGTIVASGTLQELLDNPNSVTGQCLKTVHPFPTRGARREVSGNAIKWLTLKKASLHNLQNVTARFPLNKLIVVTGVSGSGKSTLIRECLLPRLQQALDKKSKSKTFPDLTGYEHLQSVYEVDQSPIGRTLRSIPATYAGFFDDIRQLMSQVPEARLRGYSGSRFSFNSVQGRCPQCEGTGNIKLEMNFLPPAYVKCETCNGSRFNPETLDILYNGKNIAGILDMPVEQALEFFSAINKIRRPLQALADTGLGYLRLGQTSPTLSGGEAQRVKLVTHLAGGLHQADKLGMKFKSNIFILEEPTIGLHMSDVARLVEVLQRLVDAGHTVIVIEHNLDLIAEADWVLDIGPEGGTGGGQIIAEGTPEQVSMNKASHTGRYLKKLLAKK